MTDWEQDDKDIIAAQMVAAIAMTGKGLRLAADELQAAVGDADPAVGLLLALCEATSNWRTHDDSVSRSLNDGRSLSMPRPSMRASSTN